MPAEFPGSSPTFLFTLPLGCHSSTLRSTPALRCGQRGEDAEVGQRRWGSSQERKQPDGPAWHSLAAC